MFAVIEERQAIETLPAAEQTIGRYALQLLREGRLSDDVFDAALALLGREGLVDLTVLLGYYIMLGLTLLAFEVEMDEVLLRAER
jgi:4-carboxymuconolactone decarboxylase